MHNVELAKERICKIIKREHENIDNKLKEIDLIIPTRRKSINKSNCLSIFQIDLGDEYIVLDGEDANKWIEEFKNIYIDTNFKLSNLVNTIYKEWELFIKKAYKECIIKSKMKKSKCKNLGEMFNEMKKIISFDEDDIDNFSFIDKEIRPIRNLTTHDYSNLFEYYINEKDIYMANFIDSLRGYIQKQFSIILSLWDIVIRAMSGISSKISII